MITALYATDQKHFLFIDLLLIIGGEHPRKHLQVASTQSQLASLLPSSLQLRSHLLLISLYRCMEALARY